MGLVKALARTRWLTCGMIFSAVFLLQGIFGSTEAQARTVQIGHGHGHACALNDSNEVHCWGWNYFGQTGRDETQDRRTPKPFKVNLPAGRVDKIFVGGQNSCALVEGELYCWGKNDYGQLANDSGRHSYIPVKIDLPGTIETVDIGQNYMCSLIDGGVMCWGWNYSCQIGQSDCREGQDQADLFHTEPKWVHGLGPGSGVTFLDASHSHVCVVRNGGAYCWGSALFGRLGDGLRRNNPQRTPKAVLGMGNKVTEIAGGEYSTCAIRKGKVYCWGRALYFGFDDPHLHHLRPVRMPGTPGSDYSNLTNYEEHTCMLKGTQPLCFGNGAMGALGDGNDVFNPLPVQPAGLTSVRDIVVGSSSTCALLDEAVYCWGFNAHCQGGTGSCNFSNLLPNKVANLPD